ncbi:hypothetical protein Rsub_00321 [Raphidocelis subcapitata]|uniref:Peptidase M28 domain-containing protein n=1 Tax=Raphidocelis subcapitata TaxID=307507 RepID=A0A2V0NQ21_9CHLO|nr:hypothetical protein Rsub_00321 [Raphidocelis subcapitata]|eukprot:GBF87610.1 hypothetical protein Rsub_00321 [Raphidocelis subcapitata]
MSLMARAAAPQQLPRPAQLLLLLLALLAVCRSAAAATDTDPATATATATAAAAAPPPAAADGWAPGSALARVDLPPGKTLDDVPRTLPVHGLFSGADGSSYLLSVAPAELAARAASDLGGGSVIIDPDARAAGGFFLAHADARLDGDGAAAALSALRASGQPVLFEDGARAVLRGGDGRAFEAAAGLGFELERLNPRPMALPPPRGGAANVSSRATATATAAAAAAATGRPACPGLAPANAPAGAPPPEALRALVEAITRAELYAAMKPLVGKARIKVGGKRRRVRDRYTVNPGASASSAYVHDWFKALGLEGVEFHDWASGGYTGSNLLAEIPGAADPGRVLLVTAHLDSQPGGVKGQGADDNASGVAAAMVIAKALAGKRLDWTVRFALFTGEEQGCLGSGEYAEAIAAAGALPDAVINVDMIAYNKEGTDSTMSLFIRRPESGRGHSEDALLAAAFVRAVEAAGLRSPAPGGIEPVVRPTGLLRSDHAPFWHAGVPAIFVSEGWGAEANPYYHTPKDTTGTLDGEYWLAITRAVAATVAVVAGLQPG